ncbi:MAG: discoidin domain-containing protein [Dysgonamonadaceae bacterium]|jgi:hypothetical protein|nr:discoidin domain-containing protein [Dysgonamonadaceae bacterium]
MKKINFLLAMAACVLLFGACNDEPVVTVVEEPVETARSLTLTAALPDDLPETRVALTKDGLDVGLTWESTDQIQLVLVQGSTKFTGTASVSNISGDGKRAEFSVTIPSGITDGNFDLYGVYGGGGLDVTDPSLAVLPSNAGNATSLATVQSRKDVMLYFAKKGLATANPNTNVVLKHLGSLFSITLVNTGTAAISNLQGARLTSSESGWAYNFGSGGSKFDLTNETFTNTASAGNYISFSSPASTLAVGASVELWGWYPPLPDKVWPSLNIELISTSSSVIATSSNNKEARTEASAAGKSYYFYAFKSDADLQFSVKQATQSGWTTNSYSTVWDSGLWPVSNVFDGNNYSYWHSTPGNAMPQWFVVDMNAYTRIDGFTYNNRKGNNGSGNDALPKHIIIETSLDGVNWTQGVDVAELPPSRNLIVLPLSSSTFARYFRFTIQSNWGGAQFTYVGDINVYSGETQATTENDLGIGSWTVDSYSSAWNTGCTPNFLLDGKVGYFEPYDYYWHSDPNQSMPQWVIFDMQANQTLSGIRIWNRKDTNYDAEPKHITFEVSDDKTTWTMAIDEVAMSQDQSQIIDLKAPVAKSGRYLKMTVLSTWANGGYTTLGEIEAY